MAAHGTPHNSALKGAIAETVLLPGDPVRAKYIAENFLKNAEQVTDVRNVLGFTGNYEGKAVSVMASGMGSPSAGIYSYELFSFYDVKNIIRIGTAGGLSEEIAVGDVVFALSASTDSNYAYQYDLHGTYSPCVSFPLLQSAVSAAQEMQTEKKCAPFHAGAVFSSDLFSDYNALGAEKTWKRWARMGCLVQDMETYALYCNAAFLKKNALSILTMTDSCISGEGLKDSQRMSALHSMIEIALRAAIA